MTAVQGSIRPHHRAHDSVADHLVHPLDHSPEILLAIAAVIIVVAGPVMSALAMTGVVASATSVLLLALGLVLATTAAARLLRS